MAQARFSYQCQLLRGEEHGLAMQTAWIPEDFAKIGAVVDLKDPSGIWSEGWTVSQIGAVKPADDVRLNAQRNRDLFPSLRD